MQATSQRNTTHTTINLQDEILQNLDRPKELEQLYQNNKTAFKNHFNNIYYSIQKHNTAQVWNERLNFSQPDYAWGNKKELIFILIASIIAALIIKIPDYTNIKAELFYPRNISFIAFPMLIIYFGWKQQFSTIKWITLAAISITSIIYINLLPNNQKSDTLILACIHLPFFIWALVGYSFIGEHTNQITRRLDFLRFNGDLLVMTTIILIAGGILTGMTIGLFELIELKIEVFYMKNIVLCGIAATPIVATYLVQNNPQLVGKISPIIAKIFTPLVLITLVAYIVAVIVSGKDPYHNRDFLLLFNILLIGVMALILFSLSEASKSAYKKFNYILLFALAIVTIFVNGIALSAILFRISEWGITPNRIAILGGNILILLNLFLVTIKLFKAINHQNAVEQIEKSIAKFLPFYIAWTIVVVFLFPFIFQFK